MLRWRLLLGMFIIAALVALCWLDDRMPAIPGVWLMPLAVAAALLATKESWTWRLWRECVRWLDCLRRQCAVGGERLVGAILEPRWGHALRCLHSPFVVLLLIFGRNVVLQKARRQYGQPCHGHLRPRLYWANALVRGPIADYFGASVPWRRGSIVVKMGDIGAYTGRTADWPPQNGAAD